MTLNNFTLYSDINPYNPKEKFLLTNLESIYQSIINILSTVPGTRLFNRDYGCDLEGLNFELLDFATIELARYIIFNAIEKYEPRVKISDQSVITPDSANHVLDLFLVFEIKGLNEKSFSMNVTLSK